MGRKSRLPACNHKQSELVTMLQHFLGGRREKESTTESWASQIATQANIQPSTHTSPSLMTSEASRLPLSIRA